MRKTFRFGVLMAGAWILAGSTLKADEAAPVANATPAVSQPAAAAKPAVKAKKAKKAKKQVKKGAAEVWVCPMGDYKGPKTADGKCPTCGMDLVKSK